MERGAALSSSHMHPAHHVTVGVIFAGTRNQIQPGDVQQDHTDLYSSDRFELSAQITNPAQ
jgi:hypothetical protein